MMQLLQSLFTNRQSPPLQFQSHNGAIAARHNANAFAQVSQFQSHNGAIAASSKGCLLLKRMGSFNPTMVRLLPEQILGAVDAMLCFNPTMVRLLHGRL